MNLQKMMKQAQEMQQKMQDMQARLEAEESEGSSGGGLVKVRINGKNMMLKVNIDESLMKPDEKEVLEDLLIAAYNDARGKVDAAFSDQMGKMTAGLNLPPGFKMPF
ncbi:MAG: YbaB/EbfC family nucleoid-associated protein [Proteobacteria bacterium]|nr:YbaB/EbfC family nucleoid-associated protein [Pseudomonadota bacterium]